MTWTFLYDFGVRSETSLIVSIYKTDLGPAYIKSLATILVITYTIYRGISMLSHVFHSTLFGTYPYLRRESPLATIIAPSDVSNNWSFPQRKYSIYLDWFCKSLKCNHKFLKSLGATGVFLEIISKSYKENSESRKWRRESLNVCKQGLTSGFFEDLQV